MALPATGGTYAGIMQPGLNEEAIRKGIITDVYIRDYNGPATDLSDPDVGLNADGIFIPYAEDGELREDLLITSDEEVNLGFHHLASLAESGISFTPSVTTADTRTAQSRRAVRVDITEEDVSIGFSAREATPLVDYLRADRPLTSLPDLGQAGYAVTGLPEARIVTRQIIAFLFDGTHYAAIVLPRAQRSDLGATAWNRDDPDDLPLTYRGLMCPFAGYPWSICREGAGWRGLGGYPTFSLTAPVATPGATGLATLVLAVPTGVGDPFTYTVEKSTDGGTVWASATVSGTPAVAAGNITFNLTSLTAGATVFRVVATGSNELSANSPTSNSATIV